MRTILAVGQDKELLWSRSRLLCTCRAEVTSVNYKEASRLLQTRRFDLVILCHTLNSDEMAAVAQLAHGQLEDTVVLQVVFSREIDSGDIAADMSASTDPETLTATVSRILARSGERLHDGC
jgi:hypothetical protein